MVGAEGSGFPLWRLITVVSSIVPFNQRLTASGGGNETTVTASRESPTIVYSHLMVSPAVTAIISIKDYERK